MQTFLLIVILILVVINFKQADELRERKTLDAFRIVCKKLKQNTEEK